LVGGGPRYDSVYHLRVFAMLILATAPAVMPPPRPSATVTAVARARIIAAPRLDLRNPPLRIAGAQRRGRLIEFE
jgi:hypothetical protein